MVLLHSPLLPLFPSPAQRGAPFPEFSPERAPIFKSSPKRDSFPKSCQERVSVTKGNPRARRLTNTRPPAHSCLFCCRLAAPLLTLSPPSVRSAHRGSTSLHLHRGWGIPCLRLQAQSPGLSPQPVDPAAPQWLIAPSSPLWPGSLLALPLLRLHLVPPAPSGSSIPSAPPWSCQSSFLRIHAPTSFAGAISSTSALRILPITLAH